MPKRILCAAAALLVFLLAGCGGGAKSSASSDPAPEAGASAATPAVSAYDQGPRAADAAVDEEQAEKGEALFQTKGCSACHGFGKRISCPDLIGVPQQRTAKWMEQQILHPEVMTKQDPIAKQLMAQFLLQMPNQGLTPDQAKAVIEFIKKKNRPDHESKEKEAGR